MGAFSNSSASSRPSRARYGVLGFACSLALLTYLDRICIMQARKSIKDDLGFSETDMGLIFAAFLVGYLLLEVPGGWMGDRWGSRRVVTGIVLAWSLFTALTGCIWAFVLDSGRQLQMGSLAVPLAINSLAMMLLIRFLFGLAEAGAFPNVTRIIRDWFPLNERASALGWIWTCARLGGALAPILLSSVTVMLGWRQAFWLFGLIGVAWAAIFFGRFRDRPEEDPRCNDAERTLIRHASTASDTAGHAWPSWRVLVGSPTVWAVCAASFFINFGWYFYATWQPKYWDEVHGIADTNSGWLTGATFLCGAAGNLLGGLWSDRLLRRGSSRRWSRSLIGLPGYFLAGTCMLTTGFTTTVWQAETLLCLGFLVNDLTVPIIWAVCTDVGGRCAGTLSGLMNMMGGFGAVLSPALLPHAHEMLHKHFDHRISWRIIFAGLAASWFLGALTWLVIDAGKPLQSATEPEA
jgi:ACS family glucarate transporter-like MFS transporter